MSVPGGLLLPRSVGLLLTVAVLFFVPAPARAWTHIARSGETLTQLAVRYYNRPKLAMVIRAANGFVHPDDGSVTPGERIEIPEVTFHKVRDGETWGTISNAYLASAGRGPFLAKMNGFKKKEDPPPGAVIKIPYHLRHIFAVGESMAKVTRLYYGKKKSIYWLKKYNLTRKRRFRRGDVLLVPIFDLALSEAEQQRIEAISTERYTEKDIRAQRDAEPEMAAQKKAVDQGQYVRAVAIGQHLLGRGMLTVPQEITIYKQLAFSYVALGESQLALKTFTKAIELQPLMELSPMTTSPKIRHLFLKAKEAFRQAQREKKAAAETLDGPDTRRDGDAGVATSGEESKKP